jgi:hypothetical protein
MVLPQSRARIGLFEKTTRGDGSNGVSGWGIGYKYPGHVTHRMQTYLYSLLNSPSLSSAASSPHSLPPRHRSASPSPPVTETLALAAADMASSNVSTVYISVIDDVIAKVREDFITYGVGDAVLNELQAVSLTDFSSSWCSSHQITVRFPRFLLLPLGSGRKS